ncbi:hypothetical protein [Actinomadura keratinilytica]|uniref:ARB-07466-like C-terminal domain-containing protein n=1 Tax=Actinomadura keratinilytica TaxID=547461 RepID=A0ABP7Z992_9ACTN
MASHHPLDRKRRSGGGRTAARRCLAVAFALAVTAALPPAPGAAAPAEPKDSTTELAKLRKRADALAKEYRGELIALEEAKKAAQKAAQDAERLSKEFETRRGDVSRLAATSYMTGRMDTMAMVTADDPGAAVRDAAVVEHLARSNRLRIKNLETLAAKAEQSRKDAEAKVAKVRKEVEDLESQRARVKKLLAKYKPEKPSSSSGSGGTAGRPDGATGTKSPIVGNTMTARMRTLMQAIDSRFGPFPTIGCYRGGDPQDHGSGRACDFMESTAGRMPSASAQAHGDRVAQFVIDNASRYGVKYVIWKQRIWDTRSSGGWRQMEDRGSITQNHYDHVHVSVL